MDSTRFRHLLTLVLAVAAALPTAANAKSVVWTDTFNGNLVSGTMDSTYSVWLYGLSHPTASVHFSADVVNPATGASVCGTTVPAGTALQARFVPYASEQISWNGTGGAYDTPYGHWNKNAVPTSVACDPAELTSTFSSIAWGVVQTYVPLYVNPPTRSVSLSGTGVSCGSLSPNGIAQCTASNVGEATVALNYAATYGRFFWRAASSVSACSNALPNNHGSGYVTFNAPYVAMPRTINSRSNLRSAGGTAPFQFNIPAQQIYCPITIAATGESPSTPILASATDPSCTTDTPHSIIMSASDPNNDQIRYGVDWNGDGTVDQWIPTSGYVPSGTIESAARTHASPGSKTVKVLAQNTNGNTSKWAILSFSCRASSATSTGTGSSSSSSLVGSGISSSSNQGSASDLDLRVIPSLVHSGDMVHVNWSSTNMNLCTVSGTNSDTWSALQSVIGGNLSKPITAQTSYTLDCITSSGTHYQQKATVNILPNFSEQ